MEYEHHPRAVPFNRSGFTLLELLIVIAIIALLAAILFPVFSRARENARRASCLSNLKQIGVAIHQYTQDYDERLPVMSCHSLYTNASCGTGYLPGSRPWVQSIQPYLNNTQVYVCPSDSDKAGMAQGAESEAPLVDAGWPNTRVGMLGTELVAALPLSYASNQNLSDFFKASGGSAAVAAQQHPSQLFLLAEQGLHTAGVAPDAASNFGQYDMVIGNDRTGRWANGGRHFSGRAFLFADGHAKWLIDLSGSNTPAVQAAYKNIGIFSLPTD